MNERVWNLWVAFLCPFSYYFAQVDPLSFWRGTFVMMCWVGIFSEVFSFWGTLTKFDGLGFNFLTLKVFFLFVSTYESWDHLLCWVMLIVFLVFLGFGAWGEDGGTSQICNAVLYWVGWVYKRDWVKRWGWLFSCWVDEDIFSPTLSTTLSEVGLTLWALQWESWFKEKKPLS